MDVYFQTWSELSQIEADNHNNTGTYIPCAHFMTVLESVCVNGRISSGSSGWVAIYSLKVF